MINDTEKYMNYDLNALMNYEYAFTLQDILGGFEDNSNIQQIERTIKSDLRFIPISDINPETTYFISKKLLNSWFSMMIGKLVEANKNRLNIKELINHLNSLFPYVKLNSLPNEIINYGSSYGFIGSTCAQDEFVFPIAHLLSFVSNSIKIHLLQLIYALNETENNSAGLNELYTNSISKLFSDLDERSKHVLFCRIGFNTNKMTLEEIGRKLGLSRERVRQIEDKCWDCLQKFGYSRLAATALIYGTMISKGSYITNANGERNSLKLLLAELIGFPYVTIPFLKIILLGTHQVPSLKLLHPFEKPIQLAEMASLMEPIYPYLLKCDLFKLASEMLEIKNNKMRKVHKVYLTLKEIGRPAHYSEVAQVYQTLFPEDECSERSVHASLGREKLGIVWIGVKGTFALSEWGYEHPNKTLFESVFEIVEKGYDKTGQPVSFSVIQAEIGKYRRVVKFPSLTIAAYCNSKLKCINKDSFIPNKSGSNEDIDISIIELDQKLKEFEYILRRK